MQIGRTQSQIASNLRKAIQQGSLTNEGLLPIEGPLLFEEAERSGIEIVDVLVRSGTRPPLVIASMKFLSTFSKRSRIQDTRKVWSRRCGRVNSRSQTS
jgi:hypothetical protein